MYSPEGTTCLTLPTPYRQKIANFPYPLSFSALFRVTPFKLMEALRFLKLESSRQAMVKILFLACTVFNWSARVTDRRTDGQTELLWLRRATAVGAVAHNKNAIYADIKYTAARQHRSCSAVVTLFAIADFVFQHTNVTIRPQIHTARTTFHIYICANTSLLTSLWQYTIWQWWHLA